MKLKIKLFEVSEVWKAKKKHKSYENDVFIISAISNIFQNYNYCSLEMEKLSTNIRILKFAS